MGTNLRSKLSTKNPHYLDKHRYYELKHFCLQYPLWKKARNALDGFKTSVAIEPTGVHGSAQHSSVETVVEARLFYSEYMRLIEEAADEASPALARFILIGVTEGLSYEHLKARLEIPCGKDMYYEAYRRFFYILDKTRK